MIHCLHGAVGNSKNWDLFRSSFSEEILAHDLWKLFKNEQPTLQQAGQHINQQASENDVLLAYSMGGRIALHSLLHSPQKWRAAIIISAHPGLHRGQADRLSTDRRWSELAAQDWDHFLRKWNAQSILPKVPHGTFPPHPKDQASVAQSFLSWSLGQQNDLRPLLKNISTPTLWITGADDQKFTSLAKESTQALTKASHAIIPASGHRVPWEQPKQFSQVVRDFLAKSS